MILIYTAACIAMTALVLLALGGIGLMKTPVDRMLAAQLLGTMGTALLALLGHAIDARPLLDVALVLALLALVTTVAFVQRGWVQHSTGRVDHGDR